MASDLCDLENPGMPRVYLAGFEVFFTREEQAAIAASKKSICSKWGFEGVFPGDAEIRQGLEASERADEIFTRDVWLMDSCTAICANLTPFRGLSADTGTCWELGHFVGRGKIAVAYTNETRRYEDRFPLEMISDAKDSSQTPLDVMGMRIEMQNELDNCMMTKSVSHLAVAPEILDEYDKLRDLRAFEESIKLLAELCKNC